MRRMLVAMKWRGDAFGDVTDSDERQRINARLDRLALRNAVVKTTDAFDLATTPEQAMAFLTEWQDRRR